MAGTVSVPAILTLQFDFQPHRAVVRALDVRIDGRGGDFVRNAVGDEEIVDTPARVVRPGVEHIAPPCVRAGGVRVEAAEGVGEPGVQKPPEAFPFLVREARVAPVGGGIFQIDLLMGDVQVAAGDDRLFPVQLTEVCPKGFVPL